jgi:multidrug efflux system outer membrane protein
MLVGLLGKNAILIVEFAVQKHQQGMSVLEAAIEGASVRFRPILMTSFAFIAGLLPLVIGSGAGAIGNRTIGASSAGGMLLGTTSSACSSCPALAACAPTLRGVPEATAAAPALPAAFGTPTGGSGGAPADPAASTATMPWRTFFADTALSRLIETALAGNQELNILLQEIEIARNEARAASGEYLPSVGVRAGAGVEKAARYTRNGAVEEQLEVEPGKAFPDPLTDFGVAAEMSWEVDIWGRLRKSTRAAVLRYLATTEGRNFAVTHLVAEIARTYYELVAFDRRRELIVRTIDIQQDALEVIRLQKEAGRATELAVRRFEAEVQKNRTRLAETQQQITAAQNRLNLLVGRYPGRVARSDSAFGATDLRRVAPGTPADLVRHRPDVRRAELNLAAADLDVQAARARFYPALGLDGAVGLQSFELRSLATTPASLVYGVAANLAMPLFNRRGIEAAYRSANARQLQALYEYQRTLVAAFAEVSTQLARIDNLDSSYVAKSRQVEALGESIELANLLFRSARGDYLEVLLTQREALESRMELVELRQQQLDARVSAYQALGGGVPAPVTAGG